MDQKLLLASKVQRIPQSKRSLCGALFILGLETLPDQTSFTFNKFPIGQTLGLLSDKSYMNK